MSSTGKRSAPAPAPRVLGGNEPLMLDGRTAWLVISGSASVFMLTADNGVEGSTRRHLVSVDAGESILWVGTAPGTVSFAAIPVERTEVLPVPISDELQSIAENNADSKHRFRRWIESVSNEVPKIALPAAPQDSEIRTVENVRLFLEKFQSAFLNAVEQADRQRRDDHRRRFRERQNLNDRLTVETISGLARVAKRGTSLDPAAWSEPALFAAARRVGEACGITTMRIPDAAIKSRSALESILDASGARSRRVVLSGDWWKRDGGPLLAYLAEGNEPVALLPEPRSWFRRPGYRLVANSGTPVKVDHKVAATLSPVAFVFYAPLPDRLSVSELLWSALKSRSREVSVALTAGICTTLLGMLTPQATNILLEYAIPDADRLMLIQIGVALLAASAGALLFDLAQAVAMVRLTTSTASALQTGVWDRLLRQSPAFFRQFTAGDLESRANAVTQIRFVLNETVLMTLVGSVISLLNFGLMTYYSPMLAVVAAVIALIALLVNAVSGRYMSRLVRPLQEIDGQLTGLMVQLINAVPKLRIAGAETRAFAQWGMAYSRKQKLKQDLQVASDRVRLFGLMLPPVTTAILYWFAYGALFSAGQQPLTLGAFIAFSTAFGTFLTGATALGDSGAMLLTVSAMWKRMLPILETEPEAHSHKNSPGILRGSIRMDHVTFRYRHDGPLTLDDVSINVQPGECVAIVGPSGSGKSTIINLLLRFETPSAGAIYYDNHDLNSLDVLAVRRQLGVVTQENRILAGSLYDNIACGSLATMDDAWEAARAAGLDEDIKQMPMGLHTMVSEGGGNISGGQRQRLLIARAMVQKPRILILDEATSALDNRTQAIVTESLNKLQVTRIIVAHRLSTIRQADRIYVIEAGRVVQQGSFDELMRQDGVFLKLMQRQIT